MNNSPDHDHQNGPMRFFVPGVAREGGRQQACLRTPSDEEDHGDRLERL